MSVELVNLLTAILAAGRAVQMRVFKNDCPHCGTKSVAFTISEEKKFQERQPRPVSWIWDTFAQCGYCKRGIVATFQTSHPTDLPSKTSNRKLLCIAPKRPTSTAPKHTPQNAARFF